MTKRTHDGVVWISQGDKSWSSEDGNFEIEYDDTFTTECDAPHPVRIGRELRAAVKADIGTARERVWDPDLAWAVRCEKRGYLCEGGAEHHYALWVAFDIENDRVIARCDTFNEALSAVAEHIRTGDYWD